MIKENTQKNIIAVISVILLGVAIISAVKIGDQVTKYQSYKTLQAITALGKPIHSTIENLQQERLLTALYLAKKSEDISKKLKGQIPETDKKLQKFADELKATEMLLLSIPESKLKETRIAIQNQRNALNRKNQNFKDTKNFYSHVIGDFLLFLDKMYEFANDPEFSPIVKALISAEFYKETVSLEVLNVSEQIRKTEIQPGEIPLIRQMIADQMFHLENLFETSDPEILRAIKHIEGSAEKKSLMDLQKRFDEDQPALTGSPEQASEYILKGSAYLQRYSTLTTDIFKGLDRFAKQGKEEIKSEIIKTSFLALIVILILIGAIVFVQRMQAIEE